MEYIYKIFVSFFCLGLSLATVSAQTTYYSKASGNANLEATWGTNTDGSGSSPADFFSGDVFIVRNGSSLTTSGPITIDDAGIPGGGQLIIASGGTLTASHAIDFAGSETMFQIEDNGKYVHAFSTDINSTILSAVVLDFLPGSTFEIKTTGTHTNVNPVVFANLTISGTGTVVTIPSTILYMSEVLTIQSGCTLAMTNTGNFNYISNAGDMSTAGTGLLRIAGQNNNLPPNITWNFPVHYNRTATGAQRIAPGTYTSLNTSGGNRAVLGGSSITILESFTRGTGTYTIGTGATFNSYINGDRDLPDLPFYHLILNGTGTSRLTNNLTIKGDLTLNNPDGYLSINGYTLTLEGNANLSNGHLIGSASSNLTIAGNTVVSAGIGFKETGTDNYINTLTLNRTGGGGATLANNINITNQLVLTNGTLRTNNQVLGLISSSISSSARVAEVGAGAAITYGSGGGVRVERYIPAGFRSYRDLGAGVYTFNSSILDNWQEGGATPVGYGTHITGVAGTPGVDISSGLDKTQTGNVSMYTYNGTTYPAVTNTASTRLDPYGGYRILIRGDRNVNLAGTPTPTTMNRATILRATGKLIYGTVQYNTSGVSNGVHNSSYSLNSSSATGFSLIANPYASPVSWGKLLDNTGGTSNIQSTYWYFDPTLGINGVYATWIRTGGTGSESGASNGVGNTNNYIQPGQAIFVRNNSSTSPAVEFRESNKATASGATSVFSIPVSIRTDNKLGIILQRYVANRGNVVMDGSTVLFGTDNSNEVLTTEDAGKITNGNENIAIVNNTKGTTLLSIESRKPLNGQDTIPLRLWQVNNNTNYTLNIIPTYFTDNGKMVFLYDRYLNKQSYIRSGSDTISTTFTTSSADSGSFFNRFAIISKLPLPVQVSGTPVSLSGTYTGTANILSWKAENDANNLYFELEKSTNGIEFNRLATVYANAGGSYSFTDTSLQQNRFYYRVKTYRMDAGFWYSNTIQLQKNNPEAFLSVYPNPVTNNSTSLQLNQLEEGDYQLLLIGPEGTVVFTKSIYHNGISGTQPLTFNRILRNGMYQLQLIHQGSKKQYSTKIIITNR